MLADHQALCAKVFKALSRYSLKREPAAIDKADERNGSSGRIRTYNPSVNSRMLCH